MNIKALLRPGFVRLNQRFRAVMALPLGGTSAADGMWKNGEMPKSVHRTRYTVVKLEEQRRMTTSAASSSNVHASRMKKELNDIELYGQTNLIARLSSICQLTTASTAAIAIRPTDTRSAVYVLHARRGVPRTLRCAPCEPIE
eukprot:6188718-Pleurochrysis_carterae.AAC.4